MEGKTILSIIGLFLMIIGGIINGISFIIYIGYSLYQWHLGIVLSTAMWVAFMLWVKMIAISIITLIIGFVFISIGENKKKD